MSQSSEFCQNNNIFWASRDNECLNMQLNHSCFSEKGRMYSPSMKAWTALSTLLSNCCNTRTISLLLLFGTIDRIALIWREKKGQQFDTGLSYSLRQSTSLPTHVQINACYTQHTHKYIKDICTKQHPSSLYLAHTNNENNLFKRPNWNLLAKSYPLSHSGKTSLNKQTEFGLRLLLLSILFAGDLTRHITCTNLWSIRLLQWGCCMALLHWSYEQRLLDIWKTVVCVRIVTG